MARVNIPPLTRACLLLTFALSVLSGALRYQSWVSDQNDSTDTSADPPSSQLYTVPYLTVVPARSIVFPWTFVTSTLVEQNIFTLAVTLATIFYGGKYLERAWGSAEFGKFLLVVAVVPNFVTFVIYIAWFALTGNVVRSFTTICGGIALQAGFLVAFKQLVPEYTVTIFKGIIKMRVKHFPAIFLLLNTLSGPIFGTDVAAVLAWIGFLSSWTYLRFYKRSYPDLGSTQAPCLKGDASETFAIAYFFPDPIHSPVATIADVVYNLLLTLRICTPFSAADISVSNTQAQHRDSANLNSLLGGGGPQVGRSNTARAEADRRREIAMRALDQRLHAATVKNSAAAPAARDETNLDTSESKP